MYSASFDVNFIVLGRALLEISQKRAVEHQNDVTIKKIRNQRPKLHQKKRYSFVYSKVVKLRNTLMHVLSSAVAQITTDCS